MGLGADSPHLLLPIPQPQSSYSLGPSPVNEPWHHILPGSHSPDFVSETAILLSHKKVKTVITTVKLNQVRSKSREK